jgi:uncharacterized membrane protein
MSAKRIVLVYLMTTVVFFAVDMLWLGVVAKGFYRRHMGPLLAEGVNWTAAIVFYLLFIAGILVFAVFPALDKGSLGRAVLLGCLLGLLTYATYDLTNLATLKGFPPIVAVVDLAWGTFLTGVVSTAGFLIARRLG